MSERKLALLMTPARDRYANLLNQLKEIIKSEPVDVVITTVDDWKSTHIENLTIEDLKQNEHVQGLLECLKEISKTTYGTEWIIHDLEEYKSNYEIITRHFFSGQSKARAALKAWEIND